MPLITRVARLFKADLHAVLDRLEEPDTLLAQAVREMEEALAREEQQLRQLQQEQQGLLSRQETIERTLQRAENELGLCLDSGREDLARRLIRRRLETAQLQQALQDRRDVLDQTLSSGEKRLEEKRCRLEGMRQQAERLCREHNRELHNEPWSEPGLRVSDEAVEVALLAEKQRRSRS